MYWEAADSSKAMVKPSLCAFPLLPGKRGTLKAKVMKGKGVLSLPLLYSCPSFCVGFVHFGVQVLTSIRSLLLICWSHENIFSLKTEE